MTNESRLDRAPHYETSFAVYDFGRNKPEGQPIVIFVWILTVSIVVSKVTIEANSLHYIPHVSRSQRGRPAEYLAVAKSVRPCDTFDDAQRSASYRILNRHGEWLIFYLVVFDTSNTPYSLPYMSNSSYSEIPSPRTPSVSREVLAFPQHFRLVCDNPPGL
jgi:hypothetical protein